MTGFDVAIAGRGPAALSAAITLRQKGRSVVVVGPRAEADTPYPGETMSGASAHALSGLFPWDPFECSTYGETHEHASSWGSNSINERVGVFSPYGPARIVNRRRLMRELETQLNILGGAFVNTVKWHACRDGRAFVIAISNREEPKSISCSAVIDGTGARALAARAFGARRHVWARQIAFMAGYSAETLGAAMGKTVVEAMDNGWLYAIATGPGSAVVWWVTDVDIAKGLKSPASVWVPGQVCRSEHVNRWIKENNLRSDGRWAARNASVEGLDCASGDGWGAVGDAAIMLDPLSSSGISSALLSGHHAAIAISAWIDGFDGELRAYGNLICSLRQNHLRQRFRFYNLEQRWRSEPFWRRRIQTH